ncbi:MAG TPA: PIN domain-containing protein [Candidatus Binatus sp.]|nr:PIN domain-containing protein [Candidatus Binatus sp.]
MTDTHPLVWRSAGLNKRLGPAANAVYDKAESGEASIIIPSIVLAETVFIAEKRRVQLQLNSLLESFEVALNYRVYPLDFAVVKKASEMNGPGEIHDRLIVATAKHLGLELITDDREIRESGHVNTIW